MRIWTGQWQARTEARQFSAAANRKLMSLGFGSYACRVASARLGNDAPELAAPNLSDLQHYSELPDAGKAASRIVEARHRSELVMLVVDYDADGSTSGAVLMESLVNLFGFRRDLVKLTIGHRLKDGYGMTASIAERILAEPQKAGLVITADCGSADEDRIAWLKQNGIDTIVLDHHEIPGGTHPKSAYAFVSPKREDSAYDGNVAGCMVAFLVMAAVRQTLVSQGLLERNACDMRGVLEYAALGSLADCVDIGKSRTNRATIRAGLKRMNEGTRPCWRVASKHLGQGSIRLTSTDLSFGVIPRINAHSRIDEAMPGYKYLTSQTDQEALHWLHVLDRANEERKAIERQMAAGAMVIAQQQVDSGHHGIVAWMEDGHPGVQGIVASRIVERFGRPAVCLSPHAIEADWCTGSLRSIPGFSISEALDWVREQDSVLIAGGGHAMAGGVTVARKNIETFKELFERICKQKLRGRDLVSVIYNDGAISCEDVDEQLLDELATLEPFGQGFPRPTFLLTARVKAMKPVGKTGTHLKLSLTGETAVKDAIWFSARRSQDDPWPVAEGQQRTFAIEPQANWYRGLARVQIRIIGVATET